MNHWWKIAARVAYLAALTGLLYALFYAWGYDDPYITYRYARNLADGHGFVYNLGERTLSTTTPFYTLLLAGLGFIWNDLPRLANFISAASLAAGGLLLWELGRHLRAPVIGWSALLLYPTFPLVNTTIGSETPLYLALCVAAFLAYARNSLNLTAVLAALATLTRPDGILVAGILALDYGLRRFILPRVKHVPVSTGFPWQAATIFTGILLAWGLFGWAYFGNPLPVTLAAKQAQGGMAISTPFAAGLYSKIIVFYREVLLYVSMGLLAIVGLLRLAAHRDAWLLFLAWPALYFAGYSLLGVSSYFWYYAPLVPGFVVLAGAGLEALTGWLNRLYGLIGLRHIKSGSLFTGLALVGMSGWQLILLHQTSQAVDARVPVYRVAGEWLAENAAPGESAGMLEVGVMGYYAREQSIIDFAGLLQPEVAAQMTAESTFDDTASWAVSQYQPDYLVLHADAIPELLGNYISQYCKASQHINGNEHGYNTDLIIYHCSDRGP
jgi:hypothetical protein